MVRTVGIVVFLGLALKLSLASMPTDPLPINEHLRVFEPLLGKTFRGEFADSTPDKPKHDVSHWERAMNGQAVRVLHSINDGIYGGETIMMWDSSNKTIAYWYFTTAGFHTEGTMAVDGNQWTSTEKVLGNANGITEVQATSQLTPDGQLHVRSKYLSKGQWEKGHEIKYLPSPESKVTFK